MFYGRLKRIEPDEFSVNAAGVRGQSERLRWNREARLFSRHFFPKVDVTSSQSVRMLGRR